MGMCSNGSVVDSIGLWHRGGKGQSVRLDPMIRGCGCDGVCGCGEV